MVLVSRFAGPLQFGHFVFTHLSIAASGDSPVPVGSYFLTLGSLTGKSFSGTGTMPHVSQWIIGIGSPQYLCLENTQSRSLYCVLILPNFFAITGKALSESWPLNSPELMSWPSPP